MTVKGIPTTSFDVSTSSLNLHFHLPQQLPQHLASTQPPPKASSAEWAFNQQLPPVRPISLIQHIWEFDVEARLVPPKTYPRVYSRRQQAVCR